jgi:hypothetical protein
MTANFSVSTASNAEVPAEAELVSMSIMTSSYGSEVSWEIATLDETVVCEGGRNAGTYYSSSTEYEITDCELAGGDYVLNCIDSYGDGWHGATVTINGVDYCGEFLSGTGEDPGRLWTEEFTL